MFPFNIIAVIQNAIFFHSDLDMRDQFATIQGGIPVYLEVLGLGQFYFLVAILLALVFFGFAWYFSPIDLNNRFILLTLLCLLLLPNSVYAFFIIPFYFALINYSFHFQATYIIKQSKMVNNQNIS